MTIIKQKWRAVTVLYFLRDASKKNQFKRKHILIPTWNEMIDFLLFVGK